MGRPRIRPLPGTTSTTPAGKLTQIHTSTPVIIGKTQHKITKTPSSGALTNDDLSLAMQSIISDSNDPDSSLNTSTASNDSNPHKMVTNFELVTQSGKTTPLKTTLLNNSQKQVFISGSSTAVGTKIKMIPSNQFVQLKPTTLQSQSKIYTIKTSPMVGQSQSDMRIGSIVTTNPSTTNSGQHIFTLKTPNGQTTQFATAVGNQPKYTVIKNAATGNTTLQLSSGASKTLHPIASTSSGTVASSSAASNLDISSIIDMPILFADNEGNISEGMETSKTTSMGSTTSKIKPGMSETFYNLINIIHHIFIFYSVSASSSGVGQLIISQKIIKEANTPTSGTYVINKPGSIMQSQQLSNKPNKVVFINRNTMKPCSSIISRPSLPQQMSKYTKVVVTNSKSPSGGSIVPRAGTHLSTVGGSSSSPSALASSVKKINIQPLSSASSSSNSPTSTPTRSPGGILNVQTKNLPQIQIINNPNATLISTDKPQIRNIVVKPGGLKQLPPHLTSQLLNRNLTVRKLVNLVPATKSTTAASTVGGGVGPGVSITTSPVSTTAADVVVSDSAVSSPSATIQTSPKIITLNPLSRTSTPTSKSD